MTDTELAYLRTVYDAVLWLAEELRRRDPNVALPFYVSEIADSDAIRTGFRGEAGRGSGVKPDSIPI